MRKFIKCLSFVLMLGIICIGLVGCKKDKTNEEKNEDYLMVTESESKGINLKMQRLSNVATQSTTSGVEVVATVNPDNAVNKELTWTLTWKTSKSDSVSDYVTKTVSSDTLTCTLTYVKNFDIQIILTATSVANSSIKATCTVDCYKRLSKYELSLAIDFDGPCPSISADENRIIDYSGEYDSFPSALKDVYFDFEGDIENITRVGTIDSSYSITRKIQLSSELRTALTNKGITCNSTRYELVDGTTFDDIFTELCTINSLDNFKLALASTSNWFVMVVYITENGETTMLGSYRLMGFNYSASEISSISFDNTSVIF